MLRNNACSGDVLKRINLTEQTAYVIEGQTLKLTGAMILPNIEKLFRKNGSPVSESIQVIDCQYVSDLDSSFLALLLFLKKHGVTDLKIINLPNQVESLMQLYDLNKLISIEK